jgi:hypothetical protein
VRFLVFPITHDHRDPGDSRAQARPPLPQSTPKNKDLADSTPGLTLRFSDSPILRFPDVQILRFFRPAPPFFNSYCKQRHLRQSTLGPPVRDAWVALGPRLGHPRATQTQSQPAEGRNAFPSTKYQEPSTAFLLLNFQRALLPPPGRLRTEKSHLEQCYFIVFYSLLSSIK